MESRVKEVLNKKVSGKYNCAQAVACTYADIAHLDEETVYNTAAAFGAGMGCMEGTCGAIIGAGIVLGLKYKDKAQAMKAQKQVLLAFKERNGCTICKQLKGLETKKVVRECNDCVTDAAEFLGKVLLAE